MRIPRLPRRGVPRAPRSLLAALLAAGMLAVPAVAPAAPTVIDGPSGDLDIAGNAISVDAAPDGTAAIAYRKQVGGVDHVFVSRRQGGGWSPPVRVDTGLADPSGRPALAVANGGKVVVAFANGTLNNERLFAAIAPSAAAPFTGPTTLQGDLGWSEPQLELGDNGNGYLVAHHMNSGLWAYRLAGTTWTAVGAAFPGQDGNLKAAAGEQLEPGDQRGARVAVTRDGTSATVIWTESAGGGGYELYARRLTGASLANVGPAVPASLPSFEGRTGTDSANDMGDVAVDGHGTAWVAFRDAFDYNGFDRGRALVRSFNGTAFGPASAVDGLGAAPTEGAEFPRLAVNRHGAGIAASYRQTTFATHLGTLANGAWSTGVQVNLAPSEDPARATAALADSGAGLVAYLRGTGGATSILGRIHSPAGLGAVQTLSDPAYGDASTPYDSATTGTTAITAFLQGSAGTTRVVVAGVALPSSPPPPPPPPPSPAPPVDTTAPRITGLTVKPSKFRRGKRALALITAGRTAVQLTLSEAATVRFSAQRRRAGRRVGGRCVKTTRANRNRKPCTRFVLARGAATIAGRAGLNRVRFAGKLGSRRLAVGRYRLLATAEDAAGNRSDAARAAFRLLRAKRR